MPDLDQLLAAVPPTGVVDTKEVATRLAEEVSDVDDAYVVCLGRPIDEVAIKHGVRTEPVGKVIKDMLESDELREQVTQRILRRHAEVRRGFYIHVPKTAGTSVKAALQSREDWVSLDTAWLRDRKEMPLDRMLGRLSRLHGKLSNGVEMLWLSGHTALCEYTTAGMIRPNDLVFGTIRNPLELYVSEANYIVRKIVQHPLQPTSLLRSQWLTEAALGPDADLSTAARALLFGSEGFRVEMQNIMTRFFAPPNDPHALNAYSHAFAWHCDLVPSDEVGAYLTALGVREDLSRLNVSTEDQLTWQDLTREERVAIVDRFAIQDMVFWNMTRLDRESA